nr:uncharacterized protein LOC119164584 [Rhipicephalus microplus]
MQIHIGNGYFIPAGEWSLLKEFRADGTFSRALMRCLWKREELLNRRVTGTVCPRFVYQRGKTKPGLSPQKRDALQTVLVGSCFFGDRLRGAVLPIHSLGRR